METNLVNLGDEDPSRRRVQKIAREWMVVPSLMGLNQTKDISVGGRSVPGGCSRFVLKRKRNRRTLYPVCQYSFSNNLDSLSYFSRRQKSLSLPPCTPFFVCLFVWFFVRGRLLLTSMISQGLYFTNSFYNHKILQPYGLEPQR